ncbi:MAG: Hsp20 family protein, partial [Pseudomonadota bacterium]
LLAKQRNEYEAIKTQGQEKINYHREKYQQNLSLQRTESQNQIQSLQDQTIQVKQEEIRDRELELEGIRRDYSQQQKVALQTGQQKLDKTNQDYRKEIQRSHKFGDKQLALQEQEQTRVLEKSKTEYEDELKKVKTLQQDERNELSALHLSQQQEMKNEHQKILQNQTQNFKETYNKNDELNRRTLETQRDLLTRSLDKEKKEVIETVGKYNKKNDDPFYRLKTVPSDFQDGQRAYVIKTKIPEAEKDNIQVRVQKDKIVVSGQRKFEDQVREQGHLLETNSYQTFREEFSLKQPVNENAIARNYENGEMTITIPKIGWATEEGSEEGSNLS